MSAPYTDFAEYYDYDHAIEFDIGFYLDLARQCKPPILDLACGTGRVLIPLAKDGCQVYGVDISENMLKVCRERVQQEQLEERVRLSRADMTSFDLPCKDFRMIFIALRSFIHLLSREDQLACLQQVYRHLHVQGVFLLSVIVPDKQNLAQPPGGEFVLRREFDLPNGHHVVRKNRLIAHDVINQVGRFELKFEELDQRGKLVREKVVPLNTRYMLPGELETLLESTGFQVVELFGDYERKPYSGTGELIAVARRAGG